jgi:hypothetical protein
MRSTGQVLEGISEIVVETDPDDSDFFSVFGYKPGGLSGAELVGKIRGEAVAHDIRDALQAIVDDNK